MVIDLNVDIGEGFEFDELLMQKVSSCNIACGGHAGDVLSMDHTLLLAKKYKVTVGAHPSLPDKENFGRIWFDMDEDVLLDSLITQVDLLIQRAHKIGVQVKYIKPHGALYNRAASHQKIAKIVVDLCKHFNLPLMGLSYSFMEQMAFQEEVPFIKEFFADRRYHQKGTLVNRQDKKAVLEKSEEVWNQIRLLLFKKNVITIEESLIPMEADSICFHGDHLESVKLLNDVVNQFNSNGVTVKSKL